MSISLFRQCLKPGLRACAHSSLASFPLTLLSLQALGHPILGDPAYGYYGEAHPNGGFSNNIIRSMSPTYATMELRDNIEKSVKESGRTMCLHAKELSLNHPVTGEWVSFSAAPSF